MALMQSGAEVLEAVECEYPLWMAAGLCALVCIRCGGRRLASRISDQAWNDIEEYCRAIAPLVLLALFSHLTASPERSNAQAGSV
jgi:hypothetical protein